jgi:pantetheine-phosphate adenylyltransferase
MVKQKNAIYPLSADPIHNGHLYNIEVASGLFDKVIISVGNNCEKRYLFNLDERLDLARKVVYSSNLDKSKVAVEPFFGLLRNYALENGAGFIIRGCRNSKDWEYEDTLSEFNGEYGLQTLVLPSPNEFKHISSTYVKSIATEGGLVHKLVHPYVKQALEEKITGINLVGVTGNMGAGKTFFCKRLVEYSQANGTQITHIDFDKLIHSLYSGNSSLNIEIKDRIRENFGEELFDNFELNKKKLAGIVFGNENSRKTLSEILRVPSMVKLEQELKGKKGIVLIDAAYMVEYDMLPLVNFNVIFLSCDEQERYRRVLQRDGINKEELKSKTKAQYDQETKRRIIKKSQEEKNHGFFYEVDSTQEIDFNEVLGNIQSFLPLSKLGGKQNESVFS